jgi:succinylglutamate desuccinylase
MGRWLGMRRFSMIARVAALALAATLVFASAAEAASWSAGTNLRLSGPSSVREGKSFSLPGRLNSPKKECEANQTIALYMDGKKVGTTTTDNTGYYRFSKKISKKGSHKFTTRFEGTVSGVHPNIHTCQATESNVVKVKVKHHH